MFMCDRGTGNSVTPPPPPAPQPRDNHPLARVDTKCATVLAFCGGVKFECAWFVLWWMLKRVATAMLAALAGAAQLRASVSSAWTKHLCSTFHGRSNHAWRWAGQYTSVPVPVLCVPEKFDCQVAEFCSVSCLNHIQLWKLWITLHILHW